MTSACVDLRRARPLLGTVVDIAVTAPDRARGHAAIDEAFAAVEQVHRLMSFHEPHSDVSRLNRDAADMAIAVHPWTYLVLAAAADFRRSSAGLFDVSIARHLQARGVLPPPVIASEAKQSSELIPDCFGAGAPRHDGMIALLPGNRVRFASPAVRIDLGGIAKGFAVDRAVEVLRAHGIARGLVNAGGDLRAFGAAHAVDLRDPRCPAALLGHLVIADQAIASSARAVPEAAPSLIVDPHTGRAAAAALGATVLARDAVTADALTKLVVLLGRDAAPVLQRYRARALFAAPDGAVHVSGDWPEALGHAA
ncbi:MAG TPA: FAD:protein FMN transferase [Alphaproteobacteria bacterium]|nr:FAD:protein FMN transferase [Alphaproteobacteria bacterium]